MLQQFFSYLYFDIDITAALELCPKEQEDTSTMCISTSVLCENNVAALSLHVTTREYPSITAQAVQANTKMAFNSGEKTL